MDNTLKKLTDQLYQEGIEKGNLEASRIIEEARKAAENIKNEAEKEAKMLLESTKKETSELVQSAHAEIRLSADQALNALKQTITELIDNEAIDKLSRQQLSEIHSLKDIIVKMFDSWSPNNGQEAPVIALPNEIKTELETLFAKEIKTLLDKGVEIQSDKWQLDGFSIKANDDSYKINFSGDSFASFFKQFLRPKLSGILFKNDN